MDCIQPAAATYAKAVTPLNTSLQNKEYKDVYKRKLEK